MATMTPVHVLPVNDLREHDEAESCWCQPLVKHETDGVEECAACRAEWRGSKTRHLDGCANVQHGWLFTVNRIVGIVVVHHAMDGRELIEQHGIN